MSLIPWTQTDGGTDAGQCSHFFVADNSGNCVITACNEQDDGSPVPLNDFNGPHNYDVIKDRCEPDNAGGRAPADSPINIRARNNPDYSPPSRVKRGIVGELETQVMTIAESEAWFEKARQGTGPDRLLVRQDDDVRLPFFCDYRCSLSSGIDSLDR
jgi:hypothetical protein